MKKLGLLVLLFGSLCNAISITSITDNEFDAAIAETRKEMNEKQQSVLDNIVSKKSMILFYVDIKKQFEQFMNINDSAEGEKKEITDYPPCFIGDDEKEVVARIAVTLARQKIKETIADEQMYAMLGSKYDYTI